MVPGRWRAIALSKLSLQPARAANFQRLLSRVFSGAGFGILPRLRIIPYGYGSVRWFAGSECQPQRRHAQAEYRICEGCSREAALPELLDATRTGFPTVV